MIPLPTDAVKIISYILSAIGVVMQSSGAITAYFATLGTGAGQVVSLVIAGLGIVATVLGGLLHTQGTKAQANLLAAQAAAHASGLLPTHKEFPTAPTPSA